MVRQCIVTLALLQQARYDTRMNPAYQLTTLDNGLRIASEKLVGMESVTVCVSFNVGARQEEPREHGIAHFLEHMAFKGTEKRSARQIAEEFDAIGGHVNAYTSMEQTVYYARVLGQHLPVAVEILGDILQNSIFHPTEIAREQDVIIQEIAMNEDSPEDLVFDYLHEVAYAEQPLGRSILGTDESVSSFTAADLRAYVDKHYHTPSMVISAAGNLEHGALVKLVEQHFTRFGTTPAKSLPAAVYRMGEKRVDRDLEQLQLMLGFASIPLHDPDYPALQLLSTILGGGMSSRLFQEIREKLGLAYSVNSFLTTYPDTGLLGIYSATSPEKATELLPVLDEQVRQLAGTLTETELTRARNQQLAGLLMRRENPTSVAEWIARHLHDFNEYRNVQMLTQRINAVTLEDLRRVADRLFSRPQLTLAALGTEKGIRGLGAMESHFRLAS